MNDKIEQEIQAKGLMAPRVTPADIEENIVCEAYFTAAEGVRGASVGKPGESLLHEYVTHEGGPLSLLTICILVLRNGFTVSGESACASPENFNPELGLKIARQNAISKVWPLMGYELKASLQLLKHKVRRIGMKSYIGTKMIKAVPMTRLAYNNFRGWLLHADENGEDEGYLVECLDGGKPNVRGFDGYVSWAPKEQFDKAYRPCNSMTFGLAIEALNTGKGVARAVWNGSGMWLVLVKGYDYNLDKGRATAYALGCQKLPWIGMKTADNCFVPWLASQTDMLAEDWQIVE